MKIIIKIRTRTNALVLKSVRFDSLITMYNQSDACGGWDVFEISSMKEAKQFSELMQSEYKNRVTYRIKCDDGVADWGSGWIEHRKHSYQF
jgi:hypothetical protein